jgi:hypothetical protein
LAYQLECRSDARLKINLEPEKCDKSFSGQTRVEDVLHSLATMSSEFSPHPAPGQIHIAVAPPTTTIVSMPFDNHISSCLYALQGLYDAIWDIENVLTYQHDVRYDIMGDDGTQPGIKTSSCGVLDLQNHAEVLGSLGFPIEGILVIPGEYIKAMNHMDSVFSREAYNVVHGFAIIGQPGIGEQQLYQSKSGY